MNCKPGDLAVIVHRLADGTMVHVRGPAMNGDMAAWDCEVLSSMTAYRCGVPEHVNAGTHVNIKDACLRPIRDPGEDATDETLQWLDSPVKEVA